MGSELGMKSFRRSFAAGFTLIELLVVIALIALLSAGLGVVLTGGDEGTRLRGAEAQASAIFTAARTQAVLQQTEARVIIADQAYAFDRHLRYLGVVYRDPNDPAAWIATSDGALLPDSIFFWPTLSDGYGQMQLDYPRRQATTGGSDNWFYYAFNAKGEMIGPAGFAPRLCQFVLGATVWDPTEAGGPAFNTGETPLGGFGIFPLGTIAFPSNPGDLQ
jgi:prepilin-type N-terminal cleavage/methylation domain-containing protein